MPRIMNWHSCHFLGYIRATPRTAAGAAMVCWDSCNNRFIKILTCPPGTFDRRGELRKDAVVDDGHGGKATGAKAVKVVRQRYWRRTVVSLALAVLWLVMFYKTMPAIKDGGTSLPVTLLALVAGVLPAYCLYRWMAWGRWSGTGYVVEATPRDVLAACALSFPRYPFGKSRAWYSFPALLWMTCLLMIFGFCDVNPGIPGGVAYLSVLFFFGIYASWAANGLRRLTGEINEDDNIYDNTYESWKRMADRWLFSSSKH